MTFDLPVDDGQLRIAVDGPDDAAPVLMWNGALCSLRMWDRMVALLSERFRFIRFDVRGTGASWPARHPAAQYRFEQYAKDALDLLDVLELERCDVCAMAWGSRAALAFCSLHPGRVRSATLFDASIDAPDVEAQKAGVRRALERQQARGFPPVPKPDGWNHHEDALAASAAMKAAQYFDLPGAVSRLNMPVCVATGDHDPNLSSSRRLVELAPDARLVVMEEVGHASVLQRPDLTADIFLAFQNTLRQAATHSPHRESE